jgi:alkylation response protein AidB-like acyl-CoA dehydrogenase
MKLSPDHELIRDSVRRLAEAELAPIAARIDADDWFPRDFFQRLGEIGALGVLVPEEYGGSGGDISRIHGHLRRFVESLALSHRGS